MPVSNSTRAIVNAIEVLNNLQRIMSTKMKTNSAEEASTVQKIRKEIKDLNKLLTKLADQKQRNEVGSSLSDALNQLSTEASKKSTGQKNKKGC